MWRPEAFVDPDGKVTHWTVVEHVEGRDDEFPLGVLTTLTKERAEAVCAVVNGAIGVAEAAHEARPRLGDRVVIDCRSVAGVLWRYGLFTVVTIGADRFVGRCEWQYQRAQVIECLFTERRAKWWHESDPERPEDS